MIMLLIMMIIMKMMIVLLILNSNLMILCYTIKNINISVCVRSLSSVIKKENIHYPKFRLQK